MCWNSNEQLPDSQVTVITTKTVPIVYIRDTASQTANLFTLVSTAQCTPTWRQDLDTDVITQSFAICVG